MFNTVSLCAAIAFGAGASAQSTFSPAHPPAIPLAVRSPYLSTWQLAGNDPGNGGYLAGQWPKFWNGQITAWTGLVRVDGKTYVWMGEPVGNFTLVKQKSFEYTSTRSIFHQTADDQIAITATFLTPVTPTDYMRSSLISSYLEVQVSSIDGKDHEIQLYTDISAEWISGDRSSIAQWNYGVAPSASPSAYSTIAGGQNTRPADSPSIGQFISNAVDHPALDMAAQNRVTSSKRSPNKRRDSDKAALPSKGSPMGNSSSAAEGIAYHQIFRQEQQAFSEVSDLTEYGNWYYMTANSSALSHQSGADNDVRSRFVNQGSLANTADTKYRAINDSYPVFGFAIELGKVGSTPTSDLFTINLNQEDVIAFEGRLGKKSLPALSRSYYKTDLDANTFFYNDYQSAKGVADTFDKKIADDSNAEAGANYSALTTLSTRQAFASLQLAGTTNSTLLFMKEISSSGNVNTVDVIYPWHPIALYANPEYLKLVLEPIFINQEAGYWPYKFAIHDIGSHYPNATGHNDGDAEQQPLEECGNMIIMSLAYTQKTSDVRWLNSHYTILKQWASFLIDEALIPADQISTDDFAGSLANQTNLALKGIIALRAMADIANLTSHSADAANYSSIATNYIGQWVKLSASNTTPAHTTLNYGNSSSWGLLYNLYASRLLKQGDFVPQSIYDQQSAFYPTVANKYGVPLDTRHSYTKLDWEYWVAAVSSTETRDMFISKTALWLNETKTGFPLTDLYETVSGGYPGNVFIARPVVGGVFAPLVLPKSA